LAKNQVEGLESPVGYYYHRFGFFRSCGFGKKISSQPEGLILFLWGGKWIFVRFETYVISKLHGLLP